MAGILHAPRRRMATAAEINRISEQIIGAAVQVHRRIGPGCLESAYSPCLAVELQKRGLDFSTQVALTLRYDELVIHRAYQADFIVENEVVIEVKALATVGQRERRQLQTYLELEGFPLGLLLNFGATRLVDGIRRVVNNFPEGTRGASGHKA
jgi:GxxExxY protein